MRRPSALFTECASVFANHPPPTGSRLLLASTRNLCAFCDARHVVSALVIVCKSALQPETRKLLSLFLTRHIVMCSTVAPQLPRTFPRPRISFRNGPPSRVRVGVRAKADAGVPTLYGAPGSRTQIVEWLALELGVNVKSVTLNRAVMSSRSIEVSIPLVRSPG